VDRVHWPELGREVLDDLLLEAELVSEFERVKKLTPEQRAAEDEEEARQTGERWGDDWGRQLLARAIEPVDALESQGPSPELDRLDRLAEEDDSLDEGWVRRIAALTVAEIKELAGARSLTDDQANAILWRARAHVDELDGRSPSN
jgi:hypothetical protein